MEFLRYRLCNATESKNNEMIQSFLVERRKNQSFLSKKSFRKRTCRKKEHAFGDLTTNSLRGRYCETVCRLQGYKVIEKLDKV